MGALGGHLNIDYSIKNEQRKDEQSRDEQRGYARNKDEQSEATASSRLRRQHVMLVRPAFVVAGAMLMVTVLSGRSSAQEQPAGVVEDWTHHHVVFSNPGTIDEALIGGRYENWYETVHDPRYIIQQKKRSLGAKPISDLGGFFDPSGPFGPGGHHRGHGREPGSDNDWSVPMGTGTVQSNTYPAKWSFNPYTASCANDFVVYPTGSAGAPTGATIIAYSNLYSGCPTLPRPSVYWAYNTGTASTISLSPIFSADGAQLAFIQVSGTAASLVLIKWKASTTETIAAPGIPTTATTSALYRSCTAPCMIILPLLGGHNDTYSSPFYDYSHDELYVGDDSGNLHQFTGVFLGSPAETTTSWPVLLSANIKLGAPVYDNPSGYVFVANTTGNILYAVGTGNGTPTTTSGSIHGTSGSLGTGAVIDAPLVDPTAEMVYVFEGYNSGGNNAVYQFKTTFTTGTGNGATTGTTVGAGGTNDYLYDGSFDNVYFQSSAHTGNLWAVGNTGTAGGGTLYRILITANAMSATATVAYADVNHVGLIWASPLTEFCNNGASPCVSNGTNTTAGTDYLFVSMANSAACPVDTAGNGCVVAANVSTPAVPTQSGGIGSGLNITDTAGVGCWATGGIIIDNAVASGTLAGASQIYFINLNGNNPGGPTGGTLTSPGCATGTGKTIQAVQTSQAAP